MGKRSMKIIVAALVVMGMGSAAVAKSKGAPTLYDQLGKKKGITKVVNDFVGKVAADDRINHFFKDDVADKKKLNHFKMELVNQICQASGGPCKYTGKDMKTAHQGMGITEADFNALVEDLKAAMDQDNVAQDAQNQLLGALGPMKADIVEK
jgi:hemoglobin